MVSAVASPCTGICTLDPATRTCTGCRRTLEEIGRWSTTDDADRRAIVAAARQRGVWADKP